MTALTGSSITNATKSSYIERSFYAALGIGILGLGYYIYRYSISAIPSDAEKTTEKAKDLCLKIFEDRDLERKIFIILPPSMASIKSYAILESSSSKLLVDTRPGFGSTSPFCNPRLNIPIHSLAIRIVSNSRTSDKEISLPDDQMERLRQFFEGPHIPEFCCVDFAQHLVGQKGPVNSIDLTEYRAHLLSEQNTGVLKPGDIICTSLGTGFTTNDEGKITTVDDKALRHFSVYIGEDLFFSVYGNNGPFVASKLTEMLKTYPSTHVYHLVPPISTYRPKEVKFIQRYPDFHSN